jgi:TonB family protein
MKTRKTSGSLITLTKLLSALPVMAAVLITFSYCGRNRIGEAKLINISPPQLPPPPPKPPTMIGGDTIWQMVDEMALFPGGDELLVKFISKNIHYPETALAKGLTGKVIVKFCISKKGYISDCEIVKSVDPDLDAEAIRVVKSLKKFEPARIDGNAVPSWHYLPINFTLK